MDIENQEFDKWNHLKKSVNRVIKNRSFREREIWNVKIGKNIGDEVAGKGGEFLRPVLILKKFSNDVFLGVPLTSIQKTEHLQFYHPFIFKGKESIAVLTQVRLFSVKRMKYLMGTTTEENIEDIKEKLIELLQ